MVTFHGVGNGGAAIRYFKMQAQRFLRLRGSLGIYRLEIAQLKKNSEAEYPAFIMDVPSSPANFESFWSMC